MVFDAQIDNGFVAKIAEGNQALIRQIGRLRYQVFCEEMGTEPPNPARIELDHHDRHAELGMIATSAMPEQAIGCVRLISAQTSIQELPAFQYCKGAFAPAQMQRLMACDPETICEISRFAVRADYRQYSGAWEPGSGEVQTHHQISLGLYMLTGIMAQRRGFQHLVVMIEPRFARCMRFAGIRFEQVGELVEYHGKRAPFHIETQRLIDGVSRKYPHLWAQLTRSMVAPERVPLYRERFISPVKSSL